MNNVGEKYLPIGTVIMLNGASKRLMITGFCSVANDNTEVMYDYTGVMYPEGLLSSDQTAMFNHDQISQIYHMGLVDEEEVTFKNQLKAIINKANSVMPGVIGGQENTQTTASAPVQSVEQPVPPVGPGLPGYVAPQQSNGYTFDEQGNVVNAPQVAQSQPQSTVQPLTNIKFDENGTVISA